LLEKEPLQRPGEARAVTRALNQIQARVSAGGAAASHNGSDAVSKTLLKRAPVAATGNRQRKAIALLDPAPPTFRLAIPCLIALLAIVDSSGGFGVLGPESRAGITLD